MNQREVPTEAFLYKHPSSIVKQAARNVFAGYNVTSSFDGSRQFFTFPGDSLGLVLLSKTYIKYWVEELGEEKSVLYLSAFANRTNQYSPNLKHAVVRRKIKDYLVAIEEEAIGVSSQLFLSEQHLKVFRLTDELQVLYSDLQHLKDRNPNATTQIYQLRSAIRIKRVELERETDILNRFREMVEM